jgi:hypothetical protein
MSRRKSSFHPRFSVGGADVPGIKTEFSKLIYSFSFFLLGNHYRPSFDYQSHRLYYQVPIKKRADDEDSHVRTSSVSSTSAALVAPPLINQKLSVQNDTSGNVKVNIFFFFNKKYLFIRNIRLIYHHY